jgi:hypothetical protein
VAETNKLDAAFAVEVIAPFTALEKELKALEKELNTQLIRPPQDSGPLWPTCHDVVT